MENVRNALCTSSKETLFQNGVQSQKSHLLTSSIALVKLHQKQRNALIGQISLFHKVITFQSDFRTAAVENALHDAAFQTVRLVFDLVETARFALCERLAATETANAIGVEFVIQDSNDLLIISRLSAS